MPRKSIFMPTKSTNPDSLHLILQALAGPVLSIAAIPFIITAILLRYTPANNETIEKPAMQQYIKDLEIAINDCTDEWSDQLVEPATALANYYQKRRGPGPHKTTRKPCERQLMAHCMFEHPTKDTDYLHPSHQHKA